MGVENVTGVTLQRVDAITIIKRLQKGKHNKLRMKMILLVLRHHQHLHG